MTERENRKNQTYVLRTIWQKIIVEKIRHSLESDRIWQMRQETVFQLNMSELLRDISLEM